MSALGIARSTVPRLMSRTVTVTSWKAHKTGNILPHLTSPSLNRSPETTSLVSSFHTSLLNRHGDDGDLGPEVVDLTFIDKTGTETQITGRVGERLMYLAHRKGIDMEGACEASLACTTCHCYVETEEHFDILPEATETEEDLLDMAPFLDTNSRLGCQIFLTEDLNGMRIRLPRATKNFYVDGHKPQPH